ncbi:MULTISPECIES: M23 family metallopeptidase [unclassified Enterobacter]|jgi:predicted chitinase|uniref:M23 family metallopeptidase n=1 Tax=unclassified Enterobacter TaxID=2608935 RepID=UPI0015C7BF3D|nr:MULTISPECIES: M23 family metallopeptidase [unclassified Enterobacter]MBB3307567.1 hypothetical protein [Enterobacter sp. Sphag1F]NYI16345.1 hypothetical protein [Enterobacter sp. Sphag71]
MIISPPFIRVRNAETSDAAWVESMMPIDARRNFPINASASWHGGIHIIHTDRIDNEHHERIEYVRAIADGVVVSFRQPSTIEKRDAFPLNYDGRTDDGYVLLKHETEIGEDCNIVYYSLYMHLRDRLDPAITTGAKVWRKDPLGQSGMVDNTNAFHFQIFCDDTNMLKLTGRTATELDITSDGRTDTLYGDIHFYLPAGTVFYERMPEHNSPDATRLSSVHTSTEPLYVSMSFVKGDCSMITRRKNVTSFANYDEVGDPLVNTDAHPNDNSPGMELKYEYNLYNTSVRLYPQSPSAGFELLRFGRIINTDNETLTPSNAPLWRTINYPGGVGVVNLAASEIKKFSDADFPHWTGWQMIDDDADSNSQCNSPLITELRNNESFSNLRSKLICHFPLEWNSATFDLRFSWLKAGSDEEPALSEDDYNRIKDHASALCFDIGALGSGRLWHFHPVGFISHFRKCCWLSKRELKQLIPKNVLNMIRWEPINYQDDEQSTAGSIRTILNKMMQKHLITTPLRIACFLGNAIQETGWLRTMKEGYRYTEREPGTRRIIRSYNIWYYPWYGRGLLQLTNPANYFSYFTFRGYQYPENIKNVLTAEYSRLYGSRDQRYSNNHLSDTENNLTANIIAWRDNIGEEHYESAESAGFYWISRKMAFYSDAIHNLERCSVRTNAGTKIYYRSPAFWKASAAVNLPNRINTIYSQALNGFDARCCVYGSAIYVLTEQKYPSEVQDVVCEKPESEQLRR